MTLFRCLDLNILPKYGVYCLRIILYLLLQQLEDPIHQDLPTTSKQINFSDAATIDPDKHTLHRHFDSVFNPAFGAYNDYSGTIRAKFNIGPVMPTPRKGKLPL